MVSLVDIGPSKGIVSIRDKDVEVNGLTAEHIVGVLYAFPEVRMLLLQQEVDTSTLLAKFPKAIALCIAAGTGKADDNATLAVALGLGVGEQYELITKIFELTFPKGIKSFLDGINAAMQAAGVRGWEAAMTLPGQSSDASKPDVSSETAGTAPPANSPPGSNS